MVNQRSRKRLIGLVALSASAVVAFGVLRGPQIASAQDEQAQGWLEGRVTDDVGQPIGSGAIIRLMKNGNKIASALPDGDMRGFYEFRNIRPGVYELRLEKNTTFSGRPIRIWGVMVKPGVRSTLNIETDEGAGIKEIGQPEVATQSVVIISQELARLQKEIDALKNR